MMSTSKDICQNVPRSLLDTVVSDIHIADIVSHIIDWQDLAPYLDLSEVEEKDIVESYPNRPNLQRREALRKWKEANGVRATYRKLIIVLCCQNRVSTAQKLRQLLVENQDKKSTKSDVIDSFHSYLCDCYSDLPHPSFIQWPFFSNQRYIDLELYYDESPQMSRGDIDGIQQLKQVTLGSIFNVGNQKAKRKVILLEGVAGSGKTTLSWYACKEWAAGRLFKHIKLLFFVSLSDQAFHNATKLADLIPHPSQEIRDSVARAITETHGNEICFLFEACDEVPRMFRAGSFLSRFMIGNAGKSMVPSASILLTSRPGIPIHISQCLTGKIVIEGFKSLNEFIETANNKNSSQLLAALEMKPELHSLCHLPLHAVIFIHLFDFLKDKLPTTRTGLFYPLVCNFLVRHIQTRTTYDLVAIKNLPSDLPDDIHLSLRKISKLAYQSLIERNIVISHEILKSVGINPFTDDNMGFLRAHPRITMSGPTNLYTFLHLSIQEFLAALHISLLDEHDQENAFELIFRQNPLSPVLSFYAGLTGVIYFQIKFVENCMLNYRNLLISLRL